MDGKVGEEEELEVMANRGPSISHPKIGLSIPSARPCLPHCSDLEHLAYASRGRKAGGRIELGHFGAWVPNPEQRKGSSLGDPRPLDGARKPELSEKQVYPNV